MSGALKGYRYVTALGPVVTSRHHKTGAALAFLRANGHLPLAVYSLPRPAPIEPGDTLPANAQAITDLLLATRAKGTYRR